MGNWHQTLKILFWMALSVSLTAACVSHSTGTPSVILPDADAVPTGTITPTNASMGKGSISNSQPAVDSVSAHGFPDITKVVTRARPNVVSVVAEVTTIDFFGRRAQSFQSGSGVIFDPNGHIITNNHVIQGANRVSVTLDDGRKYDAQIVGADPLTDLAILEIEATTDSHLVFADPSKLRVGQWVIAIGNALALPGGPTVTVGIVSALGRTFQVQQGAPLYELIQTDTVINPGNSGGPLLNLAGEIIGINTAVVRGDQVEGIGFAVGMDTAIPVLRELIEEGRVRWGWLGVFISDLSAEEAERHDLLTKKGVLVVDVVRDGPAAQAGIHAGDVITAIDGHAVPTLQGLTNLLRSEFRAGDTVAVDLWSGDEWRTLKITLSERPAQ